MSELRWFGAGVISTLIITGQLAVLAGVILLSGIAAIAMLAVKELEDG